MNPVTPIPNPNPIIIYYMEMMIAKEYEEAKTNQEKK